MPAMQATRRDMGLPPHSMTNWHPSVRDQVMDPLRPRVPFLLPSRASGFDIHWGFRCFACENRFHAASLFRIPGGWDVDISADRLFTERSFLAHMVVHGLVNTRGLHGQERWVFDTQSEE